MHAEFAPIVWMLVIGVTVPAGWQWPLPGGRAVRAAVVGVGLRAGEVGRVVVGVLLRLADEPARAVRGGNEARALAVGGGGPCGRTRR